MSSFFGRFFGAVGNNKSEVKDEEGSVGRNRRRKNTEKERIDDNIDVY